MNCVIYEKDTKHVINISSGYITIDDYQITGTTGGGVKGYNPDKLDYILTEKNLDHIQINDETPIDLTSLNLSYQEHTELYKEILLQHEEKKFLREEAIKRLENNPI